jgi:hypothetical protein
MTETPIELIQARINSIRRELDWLDNNPKAHHPIYHETIKQCTMVELNFLEKLQVCLEEYITLPISKDHILSILWNIVNQIELDQHLNIAYAGKLSVNQQSAGYKEKALKSARDLIQIVKDKYIEEIKDE